MMTRRKNRKTSKKYGFVLYYKNIEPFGRQKRRGRRGGKQVGSCEVFGEMDFLSSACII